MNIVSRRPRRCCCLVRYPVASSKLSIGLSSHFPDLTSAEAALRSAVAAVEAAIPNAEFVEATPDLVDLADVADLIGCSRQNVRKYAVGEIRSTTHPFPAPVHCSHQSLYRLTEVVRWFGNYTVIKPAPSIHQIAFATSTVNFEHQAERLRKIGARPHHERLALGG